MSSTATCGTVMSRTMDCVVYTVKKRRNYEKSQKKMKKTSKKNKKKLKNAHIVYFFAFV